MKKWTLAAKLYASFAAVIAVMIGLGIYTIHGLNSISQVRELRKTLYVPASDLAEEILAATMKLRYEIHEYKYLKDTKHLENAKSNFNEIAKQVNNLEQFLGRFDRSLIDFNILQELKSRVEGTLREIQDIEKAVQIFSEANNNKHEKAVETFTSILAFIGKDKQIDAAQQTLLEKELLEIVRQLTKIRMAIYDMVESSMPEIYKQCEEGYNKIDDHFKTIKAMNLPEESQKEIDNHEKNVLTLKSANIELRDKLTDFVKASNSAFKEIEDFKINSDKLQTECKKRDLQNSQATDEVIENVAFSIISALALLSVATFFMAGYLVKIITTPIRGGINTIAASTTQISATVNQLATSSAETASSIAETSTTVDEIRQTAELNARKAKEVSEGSQQASETASSGLEASEAVINGMDNIRQQMQEISASILLLNEHNQMISEITETVNDLAEQSNLLAVNASIEAAKAGDQGKGFAVVAQEVRNLAEQSKASTKQVRSILSEIQKATNKAVLVTEQGSKAVEKGKGQAEAAIIVIKELSQSINAAALAATGISASSKQQLIGMEEVASSMKVVKEAANQNRISMKQLQDSAISLKGVSSDISNLIGE